jgi:hypothetical protein
LAGNGLILSRLFFGSRVDANHAAVDLFAVEFGDRQLGLLLIGHLNERVTGRATGSPIDGQVDTGHLSELSKGLAYIFGVGAISQIAYIDTHGLRLLLKKAL